jgi:tetratricopeptide (TPR) repeat protein
MSYLIRSAALAVVGAALALVATSSQAQQQSTPQQQQQTTKPTLGGQTQSPATGQAANGQTTNGQAQAPAAPKVDPAEEAAYKQFADVKPDDYDQQIQVGEDFVKKYPQSRYNVIVYSRLTTAYYSKQQMDKMYAASDKALALNPNNVQVLTLVGWVIPHNFDPNDPDADRRLQKAEVYEKHALEILAALPKPPTLTDEQFATAKAQDAAMAHSGLGLTYFREQKPQDSLNEMQQATSVGQPDPVDLFIEGLDLNGLKRYNDAVQAFDKCAQIAGVMQDRCKEQESKSKAEAGQSPK